MSSRFAIPSHNFMFQFEFFFSSLSKPMDTRKNFLDNKIQNFTFAWGAWTPAKISLHSGRVWDIRFRFSATQLDLCNKTWSKLVLKRRSVRLLKDWLIGMIGMLRCKNKWIYITSFPLNVAFRKLDFWFALVIIGAEALHSIKSWGTTTGGVANCCGSFS